MDMLVKIMMSQPAIINDKDILHQIKLSLKMPKIIEEIIVRKIIENAAANAGIKIEVEELQHGADQFRVINQLENANETLGWLEKQGFSIDDFEELIYHTVLSGKLAKNLFEDKVEPYFFENHFDYIGVSMYDIILEDEDLAIELFYAIQQGEMSFYDASHKYIYDTELRRKGGYQGIVTRKHLRPEVSAAVFSVKPPHLLKPIITSSQVHLILVEEIIQPKLDEKLYNQILSDLFHTWLQEEIEKFQFVHNF
jgi:parvulin-like peptidyl-prolyl isomerase